jgi:predicted PurR-regulated permease PerM
MLPTYAISLQNTGLDLYQQLGLSDQIQNALVVNLKDIALSLSNFTATTVNTIFNFSVNLTYGVLNFMLGIIFSVYILFSKEKLIEILRKLNLVFIKKTFAETLIHVADESSKTFARFVRGQLLGSLILGLLCFIGMLIFKIPYAPLTSVLIAVTSLIPMFGAFIGIIPATFIIYMESPVKALIFIVFIIILQQFEGNVLYPKIVGDAIGLDGFWVFLAITVGGSVYGVVGMLFGIPIMAVTYTLVREATYKRLERRKNGCL